MKKLLILILSLLSAVALHSQSMKLQLDEYYVIDIAIKGSNQESGFYYGDQDNTEITYFYPESRDYNYRIPIPSHVKEKTFNKVLFHIKKFHGYGDGSPRLTINELAVPLSPSYETLAGWNPTPPLKTKNYDTVTISPGGTEWITFDVTELFLSWLYGEKENNGFAVKPLDEHSPTYFSTFYWQSMASDPSIRPYFELFGPDIVDTLITTSDFRYIDSSEVVQNGWTLQYSGTSGTLFGVTLIDNEQGIVVGENGIILTTNNGGITWTPQNSETQHYLRGVAFINSSTGIVVGDNGTILRTTNGGVNWQPQTSGTTIRLNDVKFTSLTNAVAVGGTWSDTSVVLRSTDQGITWLPQTIPPCDALLALSFSDENNGISVGYSGGLGTIIKTTDGGVQWTAQTAPPGTGWLYGVHYINNQTGIIAGEFGRVLKTTNGGANWNAVTVPFQHYLGAYIFNADNFVLAGYGMLIRTVNGGQTWTETGSNQTLNAVYFTDTLNGIAVGYNGTIVTTTSGGLTSVAMMHNEPAEFTVLQNYPNPFNPTTTIQFSLPGDLFTTLKIVDVLGRDVETLVSATLEGGVHRYTWNGSHYSSGVYLCMLQSGQSFAVKKILLMK